MTTPVRRIVAEYASLERAVAALRRLRAEGYTHLEAYTPFPSDEVDALLPGRPSPIGWWMLAGAVTGGGGAYFLQWYAAQDYAYNVGGRPLHSWPAFIPITFECTVLVAALTGLAALAGMTRLPRLDHPLFAIPAFRRATQDRFFVALRTDDPRHTAVGLARLFEETRPVSVTEVDA
jgi:hypothetical protein